MQDCVYLISCVSCFAMLLVKYIKKYWWYIWGSTISWQFSLLPKSTCGALCPSGSHTDVYESVVMKQKVTSILKLSSKYSAVQHYYSPLQQNNKISIHQNSCWSWCNAWHLQHCTLAIPGIVMNELLILLSYAVTFAWYIFYNFVTLSPCQHPV